MDVDINMERANEKFGSFFLKFFLGTALIYAALYMLFLDQAMEYPTIGSHIAGFAGLFSPVGVLSLITGILLPTFLLSDLVALGLVGATYWFGNKFQLNKVNGIWLALIILLVITFIDDFIRGDLFFSWRLFLEGKLPDVS